MYWHFRRTFSIRYNNLIFISYRYGTRSIKQNRMRYETATFSALHLTLNKIRLIKLCLTLPCVFSVFSFRSNRVLFIEFFSNRSLWRLLNYASYLKQHYNFSIRTRYKAQRKLAIQNINAFVNRFVEDRIVARKRSRRNIGFWSSLNAAYLSDYAADLPG